MAKKAKEIESTEEVIRGTRITVEAFCLVAANLTGVQPSNAGALKMTALAQICLDRGLDFQEILEMPMREHPSMTEFIDNLVMDSEGDIEETPEGLKDGEYSIREPIGKDYLVPVPAEYESEYGSLAAITAQCAGMSWREFVKMDANRVQYWMDWVGKAAAA